MVLTALAGTFIASVIVLTIAFQITGFDILRNDEYPKIIGWLSAGSTILYWVIELYINYELQSNFQVNPDNALSAEQQVAVLFWVIRISASALFIIIATVAFWVLTIAMAIINRPTTFKGVIVVLFKFLIVSTILGISLSFVSSFTTKWIEDYFRPKSNSMNSPAQISQLPFDFVTSAQPRITQIKNDWSK
ncbi:hypothetical protein QT986_02785 [Microcoleus sp. herbarium14]